MNYLIIFLSWFKIYILQSMKPGNHFEVLWILKFLYASLKYCQVQVVYDSEGYGGFSYAFRTETNILIIYIHLLEPSFRLSGNLSMEIYVFMYSVHENFA